VVKKSLDSAYYDNEYYNRKPDIDPYLTYILDQYVLVGRDKKTILDAGCGSGVYLDFMRSRGERVFGIDFSYDAAKLSGQMNASALSLPFKNESFDVIVSIHVIEHLSQDEVDVFFCECHRVLKKNGFIFLMTPNALSPGRFILKEKWFPDSSHINIFNPFRLGCTLKKNEFLHARHVFHLALNKVKRTDKDIVRYYGLDRVFRKAPFLQDLLFYCMYSTPLAYFRDVIYTRAQVNK